MIREDAKHLLEDFVAYLRRSPDRFIDCLTDKDIEELIQALEEVTIPLIERCIKEEEIVDKFNELGMPGPILTKEMLEYVFDIKKENKNEENL